MEPASTPVARTSASATLGSSAHPPCLASLVPEATVWTLTSVSYWGVEVVRPRSAGTGAARMSAARSPATAPRATPWGPTDRTVGMWMSAWIPLSARSRENARMCQVKGKITKGRLGERNLSESEFVKIGICQDPFFATF